MDEKTATTVGERWLTALGESTERLDVIAEMLQAALDQPDATAVTAEGRLVTIADTQLWVVNFDAGEDHHVTRLTTEHLDLDAERPRMTLTQRHSRDTSTTTYTWNFAFEDGRQLEFETAKDGGKGHLRFGWRMAKQFGWAPPS